MIIFLGVELSIILASLAIVLGHLGFASKVTPVTFFLILFATILYLFEQINEK